MLFKRPEMFWRCIRCYIIWWTVLGFDSDPSQIHAKYLIILNSPHLLLSHYLPHFALLASHSLNVAGVWWTQRMSSATSSPSRCLQRCETGWPPPSPARWAWCCDATKRNLASAALSTPYRPAYLWKGERVQSSGAMWLPPFVLTSLETLKAINMFCLAWQKGNSCNYWNYLLIKAGLKLKPFLLEWIISSSSSLCNSYHNGG